MLVVDLWYQLLLVPVTTDKEQGDYRAATENKLEKMKSLLMPKYRVKAIHLFYCV